MQYNTQTNQQLEWLASCAWIRQISPETFTANRFAKIKFLDDLIVAKRDVFLTLFLQNIWNNN